MYRLMEQHLDAETGKGNSSVFNGRRNALLPAWFWMTDHTAPVTAYGGHTYDEIT